MQAQALPGADTDTAQVQAIQWYVHDYPPAYITDGALAGQGYQDRILDFFETELPEFRIERRKVPFARLIANLQHGTASCAGALGRTVDREKTMVFSKLVNMSLPVRLVVAADHVPEITALLDPDGCVPMVALNSLQGGMVQGRRYGDAIDGFLAKQHGAGFTTFAARAELVFKMLARGRVDYSFAYPDEVGYFLKLHHATDPDVRFETFPLVGSAAASYSHFACTGDAAGRAFITRANEVLDRYSASRPWYGPYFDWIDSTARADMEEALRATGFSD